MENVLLGMIMTGIFVFGLFLMNCLGRSMEKNRREMYLPQDREKSLVLLTGGKDQAEITRAIKSFHDRHGNRTVILCVDEDSALFGWIERKARTGEIEIE